MAHKGRNEGRTDEMRDVRAERAYQFWYFDLSSYIICRSATIPVTNATDWVSSLHYSLPSPFNCSGVRSSSHSLQTSFHPILRHLHTA